MGDNDILELPELPLTRAEKVGIALAVLAIVLGLVIGALAAGGVVDMSAARIMLLVAWLVAVAGAFVVEKLSSRSRKRVLISVTATALIAGAFLFGVDRYMVWKRGEQERAQNQQQRTITSTETAKPSPQVVLNAYPSPSTQSTPIPSPSIVSRAGSPMPTLSASPVVATPIPPVFAKPSHFDTQLSVKGGSPQRLSDLLTAKGYKGVMLLEELTICNGDFNETELYLGQSNVDSTNGFSLLQGDCYTERAASPQDVIDATQLYFFIKSTGKVKITLRSK